MEGLEQLAQDPRVTVRRAGPTDPDGQCVVYCVRRSQRAIDNPALDIAIEASDILKRPVVAFLGIVPFYPNANLRAYTFLAQGVSDLAESLAERGVGFVLRRHPDHSLIKFCKEVKPCLVVSDENPMREPERWRRVTAERLSLPFWTVDSDVVVPTRLMQKEHYAARTIRPHIHAYLDQFLKPSKNPRPHFRWRPLRGLQSLDPQDNLLQGLPLDRSAQPVTSFRGGTREALKALRRFLKKRLKGYSDRRNNPELDATSQLSPYLHFGHIGPLTVALAVRASDAPKPDCDAYLEQIIVRRELAINFVRFNPLYERLESCAPWARHTLDEHARDERPYLYTEAQLEKAETHDPLWNAAQQQMVYDGWMHNYLRMYWGKKILEWTPSAAEAYEIAVRLNDRYELDGRDPNGYAGIAWCIGGKHDRPWAPRRPVFGMIRYMSYASTSRKIDSGAYIAKVRALVGAARVDGRNSPAPDL
jgi:deoxyribodipyrimidine photo-lyase